MFFNSVRLFFLTLAFLSLDVNAGQVPTISGQARTQAVAEQLWYFYPQAEDPDQAVGVPLSFALTGQPSWSGFNPTSGELGGIVKVNDGQVRATSEVWFSGNLYRGSVPPTAGFDPANAASFNSRYRLAVFDGQGAGHELGLYFSLLKTTEPMQWSVHWSFDGTALNQSSTLTFDADGRLSSENSSSISLSIPSSPSIDIIELHFFSPEHRYALGQSSDAGHMNYFAQNGISQAEAANRLQTVLSVIDSTGLSASLAPFHVNVTATAISDHDGDGITDNLDGDDDNDGKADGEDAFPFDSNEWLDSDLDGIGNNADTDDDNDGILDSVDSEPLHSNVNRSPVIQGEPRRFVFSGASYHFTPQAKDADGDALTFSIGNKPDWMSFDSATGTLSADMAPLPGKSGCCSNSINDVRATQNVYLTLNLDSRAVAPSASVFLPGDSQSYNHKEQLTIVDSLGQEHDLGIYFIKNGGVPNSWYVHLSVDGTDVSSVAGAGVAKPAATIGFTSSGEPVPTFLTTIPVTGGALGISSLLSNGATFSSTLVVHFYSADMTKTSSQYASTYERTSASQDGVTQAQAKRNAMIEIRVKDSQGNTAALAGFTIDVVEGTDSDSDGISDPFDIDDDNDGIADSADSFPTDAGEFQDNDYDGVGNNTDNDDDGDGVPDGNDAFPLDPSESVDTDGDGIGNNADSDDDNDGVVDASDAFALDASEWLDSDGDGIGNNADNDDDNDGVPDGEDAFPTDAAESVDTDSDGIGNHLDTDDDGDGLGDVAESEQYHTNPLLADSDGDGLSDGDEVQRYHTNPLLADTDQDGLLDGFEVAYGLDPLTAEQSPSGDTDEDGLSDIEEMALGTSPVALDSDKDGLDDYTEVKQSASDPLVADSDEDGVSDFDEFKVFLSNPRSTDSDGDGLPDGWEVQHQLDPIQDDAALDPDGDGRSNLVELSDKTDPRAPEIVDKEQNDSLASAQSIDAGFNLMPSEDIGDRQTNTSTSVPHVTVLGHGAGEGDVDFYRFTVNKAGARAILDIDFAADAGLHFDAYLEVYDSDGRFLFANDDAAWYLYGQKGSTSSVDSYLEVILDRAGVYYVKVSAYPGPDIPKGSAYLLQVSVSDHAVVNAAAETQAP